MANDIYQRKVWFLAAAAVAVAAAFALGYLVTQYQSSAPPVQTTK